MQQETTEVFDKEPGIIPSDWSVKSLGDLYNSQYGYTESAIEKTRASNSSE